MIFKENYKILNLTILISTLLISYYHLNKGFVMSGDSYWYSQAADNLIELDLKIHKYIFNKEQVVPNFFYLFPVFLVVISKLLFGAEWQYAFMIFNLILVLFSLILFSKSLLLLNIKPALISLTIIIIPLSSDLLTWPRYILTDMIFSFLVITLVYTIVKSIAKEKSYYLILISIITLMFLTRPTSIPFFFSIICFVLIKKKKIIYNPKSILLIFFLLIVLMPLVSTLLYQFMENFLINNSKVLILINMVKDGMIIHDRPETWVRSPNTFLEVFYLYFKRLIFFFTPYIKSFSMAHNIINLLQAFIILFSLSTWFFLGDKNNIINKVIFFILLISILTAGFHSFTLIDYDFRYRFPIILPLMIIFPLSLSILIKKLFSKML